MVDRRKIAIDIAAEHVGVPISIPFIEKVAKATLIAVEIVRKNPDQVGFAVNPRR